MKKQIQEYIKYLTPKFIYIPFDDSSKLKLKKNKIVYNNMFIGNKANGNYIYSPVSGRILGAKQMSFIDGITNTLVIENDFIDKRQKLNPSKSKTSILKMKKSEVNALLERFNLSKKLSNKKNLVIESIYKKRKDLADTVINFEYYEEILETIDILMDSYNIKNAYILLSSSDMYSDFAYSKYINAFDNICIINNIKKSKNKDMINLTVEEILSISKALHNEYFNDTTFITILDKEPLIVKTKVFTHLIEMLDDLKMTYKNKQVYINDNLINNIESFIITSDVKSIEIK